MQAWPPTHSFTHLQSALRQTTSKVCHLQPFAVCHRTPLPSLCRFSGGPGCSSELAVFYGEQRCSKPQTPMLLVLWLSNPVLSVPQQLVQHQPVEPLHTVVDRQASGMLLRQACIQAAPGTGSASVALCL